MLIKSLNFIKRLGLLATLLYSNEAHLQSIGITGEVIVDENTILKMPNVLGPKCYREDYYEPCFPSTTLDLIFKGKAHHFPALIAPWEGSFFIYFVKLNSKSHAVDLNGDGFKEIAIYPVVAGNNPITKAYIYTVKRAHLLPYGTGKNSWDQGEHVFDIKRNPNFKPDI